MRVCRFSSAALEELATTGLRHLAEEGVDRTDRNVILECDVCYVGQSFALRVPVPGYSDDLDLLAEIDQEFRHAHRRLYGFASDTEPTMIVNLRGTAVGQVDRPRLTRLADGDGDAAGAVKSRRTVWFDGPVDCPIYDRARLRAGDVVEGPAIVEQMDSTTVLPPGSRTIVDAGGSLIVSLDG